MYCTHTDVLSLCDGQLSKDWDEMTVKPFIEKAQARIDAQLRFLYVVPLAEPIPDIIISIAADFAASFLIDRDYGDRRLPDQPFMADILFKRATRDLQDVVNRRSLDGLVKTIPSPGITTTPVLRTTTPNKSEMRQALDRWP